MGDLRPLREGKLLRQIVPRPLTRPRDVCGSYSVTWVLVSFQGREVGTFTPTVGPVSTRCPLPRGVPRVSGERVGVGVGFKGSDSPTSKSVSVELCR